MMFISALSIIKKIRNNLIIQEQETGGEKNGYNYTSEHCAQLKMI